MLKVLVIGASRSIGLEFIRQYRGDGHELRASASASARDEAGLEFDKLGIAGRCCRIKPRGGSFRRAGHAWTQLDGPAADPPRAAAYRREHGAGLRPSSSAQ